MSKETTTQTIDPAYRYSDRWWNRSIARLGAASLDHQLATGTPPGWSRALAARAHQLTDPAACRALAEDWGHLLDACRQPGTARNPRTPLCRDRILAAETDIRDLLTVLAAISEARPESASGVAMASMLLRDGTGPLYNQHSPTDLSTAIVNATTHMRHSTTGDRSRT